MAVDLNLIIFNLKDTIIGKKWTQKIEDIECELQIRDILICEGCSPVIVVTSSPVAKPVRSQYQDVFRVRISTYGLIFLYIKLGDITKVRLLDYPLMFGSIDSTEKKTITLKDFNLSSFQEFLATLKPAKV